MKVSGVSVGEAVIMALMLALDVYSERILLLGYLSGSHLMQIASTGKELLNRGHDVYYVLPKNSRYTPMVQNKGFKILTIDVSSTEGLFEADDMIEKLDKQLFNDTYSLYEIAFFTHAAGNRHCDLMLHDTRLIDTLRQLSFDVALVDMLIFCPCLPLLPYHLGIPFIGQASNMMNWDLGVPFLPSFMPTLVQEATHRMTFIQKLESLVTMLYVLSPFSFTGKKTTHCCTNSRPNCLPGSI